MLWHPDVDPAEVAGLASTRTFPLRSSFAPSYNMTINLVHQMGPTQAHELLERSFAQYQADRSVVGLVRGVERGERMLDEIAAELGGRDAPILEYVRLRAQISERERAQSRASRLQRSDGRQRRARRVAPRRHHHHHPRPPRRAGRRARTRPRQRRSAAAGADRTPLGGTHFVGRLLGCVGRLGSMALPKRVEHRNPRARRDLASALRSAAAGLDVPSAKGKRSGPPRERDVDPELAGLREQMRRHPAHRPAGPRRAGPPRRSDICGSSATTSSSGRRSPRPPTRWRERSTGSSCCSPSAGSSTTTDGDPRGHRRWPAAGPHLQRERPAGRRVSARRHMGGPGRPPSWRPCCRRCSTNRAATRPAARGRRHPDRQAAPCAGPDAQAVDRAAGRRAAAPDRAEP